MPDFYVLNYNSPLPGAKVTVRKVSDGTVVWFGFSDDNGLVSIGGMMVDTPYTAVVQKAGVVAGARFSLRIANNMLTPGSVNLMAVTSRQFNLQLYSGTSTAIPGASVVVRDALSVAKNTTSTDAGGRCGVTLPGDVTGWTVTITKAGLEGVVFPLERVDSHGTFVVTLAPTLLPDD